MDRGVVQEDHAVCPEIWIGDLELLLQVLEVLDEGSCSIGPCQHVKEKAAITSHGDGEGDTIEALPLALLGVPWIDPVSLLIM